MSCYLRFPGFKLKAVTLSYDDGVIYDEKLIEIMSRYGLKGTFNINSGLFGTPKRLTKEEAVKLYGGSTQEVAVHGERHLSLAETEKSAAVYDVINDRINLEKLFGRIIKGMAYANGSFNDEAVEILKICGIYYARTTIPTGKFDMPDDWLRLKPTCHHQDPNLTEYVKRFIETDAAACRYKPRLFYLWGHSYEFNDNDNWHIIENFAKEIGGRNDIWYATNGEIYDYVKAFNSLVFSADGMIISNPTSADVYLYNTMHNKEIMIPSGAVAAV